MGLISRVSSRTYRYHKYPHMSYRDHSRSPPRRSGLNFDDLHSVRIGNDLPDSITKDDLRDKFSKYGEIGDIFIPVDGSSQRSRGFAFVRYYDKRDMEDCLDDLRDGIELGGSDCKVEFIRPRDDRRGGGGGWGGDRDRGGGRDRS